MVEVTVEGAVSLRVNGLMCNYLSTKVLYMV